MSKAKPDAFSDTQIISTAYAFIGVTSAVALLRLVVYYVAPKRPMIEDALVFFAYFCNLAMCLTYVSLAPTAYKLQQVKAGKIPPWENLRADGRFVARRYFVAPLLFWTLLWTIKFSFLMMYRKLLPGVPKLYTYAWWGIVAVCVATQAGNFAAFLTACSQIRFLVNGGCKDMTTTRQLISLLYSYSADTTTNIMIMALPIRLVWNIQMPSAKKFGVMGLFASGTICIAVATVRVAQITRNVYKYGLGIDGTWLAVWGMIECSIAVVVGFVPSFAVLFRLVQERKSSYNPQGYRKQEESGPDAKHQPGFALGTISSRTKRNKKAVGLDTSDSLWVDDGGSEEGLTPDTKHDGIMVTTTFQQDHRPTTARQNIGKENDRL